MRSPSPAVTAQCASSRSSAPAASRWRPPSSCAARRLPRARAGRDLGCYDLAHVLVGEPVPTSPEHALQTRLRGPGPGMDLIVRVGHRLAGPMVAAALDELGEIVVGDAEQ